MFERADRIGGLLRYGIPEFKLEKRVLDRRLDLMMEEGVVFRTNANIGVNVPIEELRAQFDAIVLAGGSTRPRDLPVPGRELDGHPLRDGLPDAAEPPQRRRARSPTSSSSARRTSTSSSSAAATPAPTASARRIARARPACISSSCCRGRRRRACAGNPWPLWPNIFRVSSAHEEGGERLYSIATQKFTGDASGRVTTLHAQRVEMVNTDGRIEFEPVPDSEFELKADLVLLAMGFLGPGDQRHARRKLGVKMTDRGNVWRDERWMTSVPGVFTAGDMQRGQSLIVWAIAEGRSLRARRRRVPDGRTSLPAPLA